MVIRGILNAQLGSAKSGEPRGAMQRAAFLLLDLGVRAKVSSTLIVLLSASEGQSG